MTDGYEADSARLAGQAGQLDPLASRVTSIHETLSAALSEAGPCWGGDAVGQSFGTAHAGPADSTLSRLGSLPEQLGSVGTRFTDTAARYTADDDHGVERLRAAGPDVSEA
ncbi:MAG: hypothetical protein ACRDSK_10000 [Actinophytocola sp.]|uniref:hypothetical protein n=1 Tax=Actinophytocola sp. TaxID=1872138 RepID=UPI003D6C24E4